MHYYVIYTSDHGPLSIQFDCEEDLNAWCAKQDDSFESYIAVHCAGPIDQVYTPVVGQ